MRLIGTANICSSQVHESNTSTIGLQSPSTKQTRLQVEYLVNGAWTECFEQQSSAAYAALASGTPIATIEASLAPPAPPLPPHATKKEREARDNALKAHRRLPDEHRIETSLRETLPLARQRRMPPLGVRWAPPTGRRCTTIAAYCEAMQEATCNGSSPPRMAFAPAREHLWYSALALPNAAAQRAAGLMLPEGYHHSDFVAPVAWRPGLPVRPLPSCTPVQACAGLRVKWLFKDTLQAAKCCELSLIWRCCVLQEVIVKKNADAFRRGALTSPASTLALRATRRDEAFARECRRWGGYKGLYAPCGHFLGPLSAPMQRAMPLVCPTSWPWDGSACMRAPLQGFFQPFDGRVSRPEHRLLLRYTPRGAAQAWLARAATLHGASSEHWQTLLHQARKSVCAGDARALCSPGLFPWRHAGGATAAHNTAPCPVGDARGALLLLEAHAGAAIAALRALAGDYDVSQMDAAKVQQLCASAPAKLHEAPAKSESLVRSPGGAQNKQSADAAAAEVVLACLQASDSASQPQGNLDPCEDHAQRTVRTLKRAMCFCMWSWGRLAKPKLPLNRGVQ